MGKEEFRPYEDKPLSPKDFEDTKIRNKVRKVGLEVDKARILHATNDRKLVAEYIRTVRKVDRIKDKIKFSTSEEEKTKLKQELDALHLRRNWIDSIVDRKIFDKD